MSDRLQLELDSEGVLLRAIDRAIALLEHPRPLLQDVGDQLESNINLRFDTKTDPAGNAWAPLSPVTVDHWYAIKYPDGIPGSLLERTRQLRNSLAFNVGDDYVEIGTSRRVPGKSQPFWEIGMLHETGTRTMPRRGLLVANAKTGELGAGDQADVLEIVGRFLGDALA